MCYMTMDFITGALVPAVLLYPPAPKLPANICLRCYGTGIEYVPDWMGIKRALPCVCEDGQRAKRQEIAALGYDVFVLPVERQIEQFGAEAGGDAWYYRSLLEEDHAREQAALRSWAVQL